MDNKIVKNGGLKQDDFYGVIEKSPLVSVDLIIINDHNEIILGHRNNDPAINTFFTPGSVIRKYEKVVETVKRILNDELGLNIENIESKLKFNGVFSHFYENNFKNNHFGTHYVCLSYIIRTKKDEIKIKYHKNKSDYYNQHKNIIWSPIQNIENNKNIHFYVKEMVKNLL